MHALYLIQPDDANHLEILDNGRLVVYIRVNGEELKRLLRGDAGFVETGAWDEESKKAFYRAAELFKNKQVEYIVFQNYPGVRPFKYKVKPENIRIEKMGIMKTRYILRLEDKIVEILTHYRSITRDGYPYTVLVLEKKLEKPEKKPAVEKNILREIYEKLLEADSILSRVDPRKSRKKELTKTLVEVKIKIASIIPELRQLVEEEK